MRWSSGRGRGGGRGLVAALLGLALVIGIAACDGGGEDPTPTGSGSGSGSADSTTGPSDTEEPTTAEQPSDDVATPPELDEPELPDAATVDDRAGAAAFAEYYFAVLNYAYATGDMRRIEAISSPDCTYCEVRIEAATEMAEYGAWLESADPELTDVRVEFPQTGTTEYVVRFVLTIPDSKVHYPDGRVEANDGETYPHAALGATWIDGRFLLSGVNLDTDD